MLSALYYPHTAIRDEGFLKHALLYWDEVEFISPFSKYDASYQYADSLAKEAAKILKPHVPTPAEKKRAHDQIMALIEGELPPWLEVDRDRTDDNDAELYPMYQHKLLPETWEALKRRRLVQFQRHGDFDDYASHTYLGLTMMAILARCCAGSLKHTITDRDQSYYALLNHLRYLSGGDDPAAGAVPPAVRTAFSGWLAALGITRSRAEDETRKALISITLEVIDSGALSLHELLVLRNDRTQLATELRQNYAKAIENYVDKMSSPDLTDTDVTTLTEDFRKRMKFDLDRLYADLRPIAKKTLLSKEVAVAIMAPLLGSTALIASGVGAPIAGAIGVGALGKLAVEYRSARDAVFQKHPMAFLYARKGIRLY